MVLTDNCALVVAAPSVVPSEEQGVATPCSSAAVKILSHGTEEKKIYHITWVTHNSRVSERMKKYHVRHGEPVWFDEQSEIMITKIIAEVVREKGYKIYAFNICKDHVHMLIECSERKIANTVRLLKGKSSQRYKEFCNIPAQEQFHLWAQKYNKWLIENEEQFVNTAAYIANNRQKHGLPENKGLQPLVLRILYSR